MSQAEVFKKGDRCGRFLIEGWIGQGASGEVYRATDPENLDQAVAIKVLALSRLHDQRAIQRMNEEALLQRNLDDPHIVRVFAIGTMPNGTVWIAMEYLQGSTLRDRISRLGALPLPYAVRYAIDIASGMGSVHDYGAIHRDLKPENLFVTNKGLLKILDFGVAKLELFGIGLTDPGSHPGTWPYMSPEQAHGQRLDPRSDLFCLGLIFVEMVLGEPIWVPQSLLEKPTLFEFCKLYDRWVPIDLHEIDPAIPPYIAEPVKKALAKGPEDRQESMHEFRRELRAAERRFFIENPDWEQEIEQRERERQRKAVAEAHATQGGRPTRIPTLEMRRPAIKVPTPLTISAPAGKRYGRGIQNDTVPYQAVQRLRIGLFIRMLHAAQDFWSVTSPRARATGLGITIGIAFTAVLLIRNDVLNPAARAFLRALPARERVSGDSLAKAMADGKVEKERTPMLIAPSDPAPPPAGVSSVASSATSDAPSAPLPERPSAGADGEPASAKSGAPMPEASSLASSRAPARAAVAPPRRKKAVMPASDQDLLLLWAPASPSASGSPTSRPIESIPVPF
jgi:serine/threonine protein kinase